MTDDRMKKCPEYCPFLKANGTFCELFHRNLQSIHGLVMKCMECLNPEQRKTSYKALGLSIDNRADMWHKAVLKHNEIELGKKRQEEVIRKKFAAFIEDKFGAKAPLEGNAYLTNLLINLFMVLDATERSMMMTILNSNNGIMLIETLDRTPKDEHLLRNFRRELDNHYLEYQQEIKKLQNQNTNINFK